MVDSEVKETISVSLKFLKDKKVQNIILIVLLLATVFLGAYIRLQDLPNLKDSTTGDYTPLALDPYYFLRVSETMHAGPLPTIDPLRYPGLNPGWTTELNPKATLIVHQVTSIFSPHSTLRFANVINPVVFFVLGIIVFFFLIFLLSRSKWVALIATGVLSVIPPYLYRTLAGFSDHESLGMFGFFLALLAFSYAITLLEKKKSNPLKSTTIGILSGIFTMLAIAGWGGGARFLFMILPLAFIVIWLMKKDKNEKNSIIFYSSWVLGVLLSSYLFGYTPTGVLFNFMTSPSGFLSIFVLGYILVDFLFKKYKLQKNSKFKELINIGVVIVLGGILYQLFVGNVFSLITNVLGALINPFGTERVTLTVAENAQPYLNDWIGQIGSFAFYLFLIGCFIIGGKVAKGIKIKKLRYLFTISFAVFVLGILFSRISSTSLLNGENFLSKAFFFLSFLFFFITAVYTYHKSEWEIDHRWVFIAVWMVPMLLSVRSAVRTFFAIVPFVSFMVPLTIFEVGKFARRSKDEVTKMVSFLLLGVLIVALVLTFSGFYNSSIGQSQNQHPSYNNDWQNSMNWVRTNTPSGSLFLHWWDYGYWVQTGGERPTVTDGGHYNAFWDHLIARYVLTTPNPDTAKSFMKIHNVSYFLMDPTDIGKYSAYSSIGDDENTSDRASFLPTFLSDPKETQETSNGTTRIYRGGFPLDSDLVLTNTGKKFLLPKGGAGIFAFAVRSDNKSYSQPIGIYVYNGQQYNAPIRYLYSKDAGLLDFKTGINATIYLYASVQGQQFDLGGAGIYLSDKTMNSLAVELYLMNDVKNEYPELKLVDQSGSYPFNFYYQGFRGPIRIWEVDTSKMENIIGREEFMRPSGSYGEFDDLEFKV